MVGAQQALTGRKVYGQGSFAPTKGRVSANGMQGYLARSQRQQFQPGGVRRVGGDGQSDTRSGLAQAAMQRRQGGGGGSSFQQPRNRRPFNNGGRTAVGGGSAGAAATVSSGGEVPQVVVNNNGQLELPYSPAWSQELLESMGQYNQDLAGLQTEQQQEGLQYQANQRLSGENYNKQKGVTLNNNAGAGTAFSSSYGVQASGDANEYQNTINQLLADHNAATTAFDTERTAIINAFKAQLQQRSLAYADEVAQSAGTLGYGQARGERRRGQNSSAYAAGAKARLQKKNQKGKK